MYTRRNVVAVVALCSLFVASWLLFPDAAASEEAREPALPLAEMALGASRIDWQPAGDYEQVALTLAGPEGLWLRKEFEAGQPATLGLFDQKGSQLPDGAYSYELQFVPRQAGDRSDRPLRQSGAFAVREGTFAASFEERKIPGDEEPDTKPKIRNVTAATEVIPEHLVVQGNACIGDLCTSDDTAGPLLRVKSSTNVGILFEDVATGITHDRDWVLQANAFQGDNDRFFLQDVDAATIPVSVYGNSPENTLVLRSGKVGIGTAFPGALLHIHGTATSDAFASIGQDPVSGPALNFGYGGGSFGRGAGFFHVRPDASATAPNPSLRFLTANVERMIITNTGYVGIGTSAPSVRLDVKENVATTAVARLQNLSATGFSAIEYLDNAGNGDLFFGIDNAASTTRLNSVNNNPIVILTNSTERARITSAGDVGIGTSTPSSKFHVNGGDIRVSGGSFIDDGTTLNVPDFVFEPDYRLMPLDELREFVSREKHLPNVPSADDVKKDGLNLSQVQMRLLEKLEELTLYTLKQDEQVKALQSENAKLNARLAALETAAEQQ